MKKGHIAHAVCPTFLFKFLKRVWGKLLQKFSPRNLFYLQASSTATAHATVIWSIYAPTMGLLPAPMKAILLEDVQCSLDAIHNNVVCVAYCCAIINFVSTYIVIDKSETNFVTSFAMVVVLHFCGFCCYIRIANLFTQRKSLIDGVNDTRNLVKTPSIFNSNVI